MDTHEDKRPKKNSFKLENNKNGEILNFHNTIEAENGNIIRIRFVNACFNYLSTQLVSIDHQGNIFIVDFVARKIWKLFQKCKRSTVVECNPYLPTEFFIGTKDGNIIAVDIEKGYITKSRNFSLLPVNIISLPTHSNLGNVNVNNFLVATNAEAFIIDKNTFEAHYKLELDVGSVSIPTSLQKPCLKFISYFPNSERIFACFTNDSIHVWSIHGNPKDDQSECIDSKAGGDIGDPEISRSASDSAIKDKTSDINSSINFCIKTLRIFYPIKIREKMLKMNKDQISELKITEEIYECNTSTIDIEGKFVNSQIKDLSNGLINSYHFSLDGNLISMTTIDGYIIILSTITLEVRKIIKTGEVSIKQFFCFEKTFGTISEIQNQNDLIAFAVTADDDIILVDCKDSIIKTIIFSGGLTYKAYLSNNGTLLSVILKTGEIKVFQTLSALNALLKTQQNITAVNKPGRIINKEENNFVLNKELKKLLSHQKLLPILKECGSYSDKYRYLIWTCLLDLPSNKMQFAELIKKGLHPAVTKYDNDFPLKDATILRNLKKVCSCLIFWTKILAECDYLPKFVFPFLKIFPNNILLTFEVIVSIIKNHGQLWFEFAPMEPINYLGLIENALNHFDPKLHQFYKDRNITTKTYAWSLLTTAFSEVLDEQQWYQLWDNILTNDVDYLIFAVLAYQMQQRNIIMALETVESIENFFHQQYIVDMPGVVKRANDLIKDCPNELHPKRYLKSYTPLPKDFYPVFEKYPKEWFEKKDKEIDAINIENAILDKRFRELELEELQLATELENGLKDEENQRRLKELEKLYSTAIAREEERIACQRKLVLLYQKEMRNRRRKILDIVRDSMNRKDINLHENQLDTLMRNIERARVRDETYMMMADEDLKDRELNLLSELYKKKSDDMNAADITINARKSKHNPAKNIKNSDDTKYIDDSTNISKSRSIFDFSRSIKSKTVTTAPILNTKTNKLNEEIQKRNDVIRKTYGVQLKTDQNQPGLDKKRTMKKQKTNNIDKIERILNEIEMEFENIVDPGIGS